MSARLKCAVPVCKYYGKNLMCPPNVIAVEEFKQFLSKYSYGIIIQVEIAFTEEMIKIIGSHKDLASLTQSEEFNKSFDESLLLAMNNLDEIVHRVEARSFMLGHRFAIGFNVGPCMLCEECVNVHAGESCRLPYKARTSMEAIGINVFETAKRVDLEFEQPAKNKAVFNGLVLVE